MYRNIQYHCVKRIRFFDDPKIHCAILIEKFVDKNTWVDKQHTLLKLIKSGQNPAPILWR